jgi:hypothetical protein
MRGAGGGARLKRIAVRKTFLIETELAAKFVNGGRVLVVDGQTQSLAGGAERLGKLTGFGIGCRES